MSRNTDPHAGAVVPRAPQQLVAAWLLRTAVQVVAVGLYGAWMGRFNAWVAVLVVAGCGTEKTAVEKCDDLVDTLCTRGVQCLGGAYSECVQAVKSELPELR